MGILNSIAVDENDNKTIFTSFVKILKQRINRYPLFVKFE